ncbi:hypothetical protein KFE96_00640 [Kordiimonas sp. SCSIO 12603]|uniref:hypothetical protein n=1 Tax=Kordiimonas sp. SCSIO 12603 TaxID=2829596 RepID=UPI00210529FE|nr:hypothetical protein [Kordiimonas sp. SCSIO 12603]UTW58850.1 hypothetical protein KFE96_00640 [Kordiimonas sp. SCSIO 12603]
MVKKRHLNAEELRIYEEFEAEYKEDIKVAKARLKELEQDPEYDGSIYVQHDCDGMEGSDGTLHALNEMLVEDGFMPSISPFDVKHKSKDRFSFVLMREDGIDPIAFHAREENIERMSMARQKELIAEYEAAEQRFSLVESLLDKPYLEDSHTDCEKIRKQSHDEMITLGHQIIIEENKFNEKRPGVKRDYFGDRAKEEQRHEETIQKSMAALDKETEQNEELELTAEEVIHSDLSWEEKKELFAKLHAETKAKEKEQGLAKDKDELEM